MLSKTLGLALLAAPVLATQLEIRDANNGTTSVPPVPTDNIKFAPVNHPDTNTQSAEPLQPSAEHVIWLAQMETGSQDAKRRIDAAMLVKTNETIVNLGATDLITGISCKGDKLTIEFKDEATKKQAIQTWSKSLNKDGTQTFLDAYGEECGKADELQFMKATLSKGNPNAAGNTVTYPFVDLPMDQVLGGMHTAWGDQHKKAIDNCGGVPGAPGYSRVTRRAVLNSPSAQFVGDWPQEGTLNPVGQKSVEKALKKRGLSKRALISKDWNKQLPIDWSLKSDTTAFGPGKIIFTDASKGVTVSCVGCGITGTLSTSGAVSWGPFEGKKGNILINPKMKGQIAIGVEAQKSLSASAAGELSTELKKSFDFGFPGLSLAGVLTLGPYASLEPFAKVGLTTSGKLLLGGSLEWVDASAYFDLTDSKKNKQTGWKPKATPIFQAAAEIAAEASAGVRASINCGVSFHIGSWDFKKGVGIADEVAVVATAGAAISAMLDPNTGKLVKDPKPGVSGCDGINFSLKLSNKLYAEVDLIGKNSIPFWAPEWSIIPPVCWKWADIQAFFTAGPTCTTGTNTCLKPKPKTT